MNIVSRMTLLVICVVFAMPSFADDDPKKAAIKARQGDMQLRAFNTKQLVGMAKGKIPYDAKKAQVAADNLKTLLGMKNAALWGEGTSTNEYANDTAALQKIWETWPKMAESGKAYAKAVNAVAAAAGKGKDSLAKAAGELGKACKSCHDDYRKKDE